MTTSMLRLFKNYIQLTASFFLTYSCLLKPRPLSSKVENFQNNTNTKTQTPHSSKTRTFEPLALNSVFGKILEKLLNNRIYHFLFINNLLQKNQYGFKYGTSAVI